MVTGRKHRETGGHGIPLGEGPVGGDRDLGLLAGDGDGVAEAPGLAAGDLDALLQELLERGDLHDLVLHGLGAVDREGDRALLLAPCRAGLRRHHTARHLPCPSAGARVGREVWRLGFFPRREKGLMRLVTYI